MLVPRSLRSDLPSPTGTRPRNRHALIVAAATELFYERGFDQVGMGEIAEAVGVGPSALYRHFSGKQALLKEVLDTAFAPLFAMVGELDLGDRSAARTRLGEIAVDHRELAVLWQREARHLAEADQAKLFDGLREVGRDLGTMIAQQRPDLGETGADLVAWSAIAVLANLSFHHLSVSRHALVELMAELADTVLDADLPALVSPAEQRQPAPLLPWSRREALLDQAVRMFARDGYSQVGIEDIGAAVGIAGPSVYNHFDSKGEMLLVALQRGIDVLYLDLATIRRTSTDSAEALAKCVASYVRFALDHHDILDLLITEIRQLPDTERAATLQTQRDYVGEWVHLLTTVSPDLEPTTARIRVHAALTVANDIARVPHLRRVDGIADALRTICTRLLTPRAMRSS